LGTSLPEGVVVVLDPQRLAVLESRDY